MAKDRFEEPIEGRFVAEAKAIVEAATPHPGGPFGLGGHPEAPPAQVGPQLGHGDITERVAALEIAIRNILVRL